MDAFTLEKIGFDALRLILASYCRCSLGKSQARRINPSTKPDVVRNWLGQTTQMVQALCDAGLPPTGSVADISGALDRARPPCGASGEDFSQIASTLQAVSSVREYLANLPSELDQLRAMTTRLADFTSQVQAIRAVVAPDGSVRDDASAHLGKLRRDIAKTTTEIHDVMHSYLRNPAVKKLLTSVNITIHSDRYVLPVRADNRGRLPGVVHRQSHSGQTVFVEPNASVQLNNHLVDLRDHERMEIERLLSELGVKIHTRTKAINLALAALAKIDLLGAKAQYAYQFNMTCPEIVDFPHKKSDAPRDNTGLEFFQARHPLLELQFAQKTANDAKPSQTPDAEPQHIVPIDVRLGSDFDVLIITGSNTGGKTVTLKTVALLVAMAQAGLHIPVRRGSRMPVFDDVLIDIGDEQSLEQSLSTFGAHIARLKHILSRATPKTLVLLDELGSGTDPDEGGAIGQAVMDELRRIGCGAMVSTHFSILKAYAIDHSRVDNASVEFDTRTLRPTYHLRIGTPGESHAITVASKLGLPGRVIDAARKHLGQRGGQLRRALRKTGSARRDAEEARLAAASAQLRATTQAEQLQTKMDDFAQLKGELATWLARLTEMKPGDEIFVPATGRVATLARLELHKQMAVVNAGNVQMEIPLADLMPDLGQQSVRQELTRYRKKAETQSQQLARQLAQVKEKLESAAKLERQQKEQAKRFDRWLGQIARMKIGEEIPVNAAPGRAKLTKVDLPGLRATVELPAGQVKQLSLQDLFPQDGPFAQGAEQESHSGKSRPPKTKRTAKDKPIRRGQAQGKTAKKKRQALLATEPGQKVFVIPFNTAATLVRIDQSKDRAIVLRGALEMQVAIADLEPVGY